MLKDSDEWKDNSEKQHVNGDQKFGVEDEGEETRSIGITFGGNN